MAMSEKMFIIIGSFMFGYCIGYYSFELVKSKNWKSEIYDLFLSYNKRNGLQRRSINKKKFKKWKLAMIAFLVTTFHMKKNF